MSKRDDGGPAYPRPASEYTKNGTLHDGNDAVGEQDGMSLRDAFAAEAPPPPQWWLRSYKTCFDESGDLKSAAEHMAIWRYAYADAMLRERAK